MKLGIALETVRSFSRLMRHADAPKTAGALDAFVSAVERVSTRSTSDFCSKLISHITKTKPADTLDDASSMSAVRTAIADLVDLLKLAAAKKALIEDLTLLLDLCTKLNDTSLTAFESHVVSAFQIELGAANVDRLNVIDCYLARLEASLGDDAAFRAVYSELCADKRITQADVVSIASRFLSPIASSTSRPKALKHILKRHEKLLDHRNAASVIGSRAA